MFHILPRRREMRRLQMRLMISQNMRLWSMKSILSLAKKVLLKKPMNIFKKDLKSAAKAIANNDDDIDVHKEEVTVKLNEEEKVDQY